MKYILSLLLCLPFLSALAQRPSFTVLPLSLPKELEFSDNQFSGLAISNGNLFLLGESRLQDKAQAKLYIVPLTDLDRKLQDSTHVLSYQKMPINKLQVLRARMKKAGQDYEGLEALLVKGTTIYFSVETATPSNNCYLLKGQILPTTIELDTTFMVTLPKPRAANGSHIYNAGFEALAEVDKQVVAFFEFNSFPIQNYAYGFSQKKLATASSPSLLPFNALPFRITDITPVGKNRYTAINYFFKGGGGDAVYRPAAGPDAQMVTEPGGYKNYCRLIDITFKNNRFAWEPLWEFPTQYMGYNWEGMAAYKGGYFIINDKYTPNRPYRTTLLYLKSSR